MTSPNAKRADSPTRSAVNWFVDAATYALDGDREHALEAALAGIEALNDAAEDDD